MLQDAKIVSGNVYSLSPTSLVKSESIFQPTGIDDFRTFSNIQTMLKYKNIQQSAEVDIILTDESISEGDMLYDVDAGVEFPAGAVTVADANAAIEYNMHIVDIHCEYSDDYTSEQLESASFVWSAKNMLGVGIAYYTQIKLNGYITIELESSLTIVKLAFKTDRVSTFSGSNDGITFTDILTLPNTSDVYTTADISDPKDYKFYKISNNNSSYDIRIHLLRFFTVPNQVDISSYSNGANIPNIIKIPDTSFNNELLTLEKTIKSDDGFLFIHYNDKVIYPSRELETEIAFKQHGSQLNEIYYEYESLKTEAIIQTDDSTPNAVTSTEASPYLAFDGDSSSIAYSVACDATGVCSVEHKMTFASPTFIYKLGMVTSTAANAPKHYIFSGSDDDTTYTTILDVTQDVSIDDLELTKTYDPSIYHAYTYYKIVVDQGPVSDNVEVKQYKLYKEI